MEYGSPGWIIVQAAAAGVIGGMSVLLWIWWRGNRRDAAVGWLVLWSLTLSALFLLNAVLPIVVTGDGTDVLLFVRSQVLGLSILLAIPVMKAATNGPPARWFVIAAGTVLAVRAVLFATTDLVFAHEYVGGVPQYGPLVTPSFLVPLGIAVLYVAICQFRLPSAKVRAVVIASAVVSVALLVFAFYTTNAPLGELLTALWALPLIVVVVGLSLSRLKTTQATALRQQRMRDAVAALANAAWFDSEPDVLLERAQTSARLLLDDDAVEGHLRRLTRGGYHTSFSASPGTLEDPQLAAFLDDLGHVVSAAAARRALAAQLHEAAYTDALTGLPNRRALDEKVAELLAAEPRGRVAVLFCDMDSFKRVNEELGHPFGDTVLLDAAESLREAAGPDAFVARYGGDEFVVVLPHADDDDGLRDRALTLQRAVVGSGQGHVRSLSIGIAAAEPEELREAHTLVRDADSAMFEAKHRGSGVRVFDSALRSRVLASIELSRQIARAVDAGEFEAQFQPIVDVASLTVVAVETLSRWTHEGTERPPELWVPVAEDSGQIVAIGLAALRAARTATDLFDLPVGVNLSVRQLAEQDLTQQILDTWGSERRDRLTLEITETALLGDVDLGRGTLESLREAGVRIALDDFGTGYSSLARLAELPIDVLKVDQQFTRDVTSSRGRSVMQGVLEIAHAHGLDVVVEGVETVDQLDVLAELGADRVQGYLLGRPASAAPAKVRLPRPLRSAAAGVATSS